MKQKQPTLTTTKVEPGVYNFEDAQSHTNWHLIKVREDVWRWQGVEEKHIQSSTTFPSKKNALTNLWEYLSEFTPEPQEESGTLSQSFYRIEDSAPGRVKVLVCLKGTARPGRIGLTSSSTRDFVVEIIGGSVQGCLDVAYQEAWYSEKDFLWPHLSFSGRDPAKQTRVFEDLGESLNDRANRILHHG